MAPHNLTPFLQSKLQEYRGIKDFDPLAWVDSKCLALNQYMTKHNLSGCVTSVSGGIDSAVTLFLCARAKQMPQSPIRRNIALCQPIESSDWATERGMENAKACGAEIVLIDQTASHRLLSAKIETAMGVEKPNTFARGQLRSYMRTPVSYYVAQLLGAQECPAIVMGTGNRDEDGYLGYFCKAGDGVFDVSLISDLHKSEVYAVGQHLSVPLNTLNASPSADLWPNQTDEDELNVLYDTVELYTGWFLQLAKEEQDQFLSSMDETSKSIFLKDATQIESLHRRNAHKLSPSVLL